MSVARQAPPAFDFGSVPTESNGTRILAITGFFTVFACTVVILRMFVRVTMLKMMGGDDYVMILAMLCSATVFVFFVAEVQAGVGEHFGNPHLMSNYVTILHWSYHHGWILVVGISSVKISVGLFLLRLVQGKWYKRCIFGWIAFLIILTIACVLTIIFQCLPVEGAWDFMVKMDPDTRCYSIKVFRSVGLFNGAINIATDFVFASLPIPIILPLRINMRTKISLICILGLGYFACSAAIVKEHLLSDFFENYDSMFNNAFNVWNDIELNVGILAACLPALRPLFQSLLDSTSIITNTTSITPNSRNRQYTTFTTPNPNSNQNDEEKELNFMPSGSTLNRNNNDTYGVRITAGSPHNSEDDYGFEDRIYRQDSFGSGGPMSKLEESVYSDHDDEKYHEGYSGLARVERAHVRDFGDSRGGILRTTEVVVSR